MQKLRSILSQTGIKLHAAPEIIDLIGNCMATYCPLPEAVETPWKECPCLKKGLYSTYQLKGYGDMDSAAAHELTQSLQEIRKRVHQIFKALE
jgi:hypothetical protein